jgi:hypothetical protein
MAAVMVVVMAMEMRWEMAAARVCRWLEVLCFDEWLSLLAN